MICTLFCVAVLNGQYSEPLAKASEAAYIQTGVKKHVDMAQRFAEDTSTKYVRKFKLEPLIGAYGIYARREVTFPIFNDTVSLRPTEITWTHRW